MSHLQPVLLVLFATPLDAPSEGVKLELVLLAHLQLLVRNLHVVLWRGRVEAGLSWVGGGDELA